MGLHPNLLLNNSVGFPLLQPVFALKNSPYNLWKIGLVTKKKLSNAWNISKIGFPKYCQNHAVTYSSCNAKTCKTQTQTYYFARPTDKHSILQDAHTNILFTRRTHKHTILQDAHTNILFYNKQTETDYFSKRTHKHIPYNVLWKDISDILCNVHFIIASEINIIIFKLQILQISAGSDRKVLMQYICYLFL